MVLETVTKNLYLSGRYFNQWKYVTQLHKNLTCAEMFLLKLCLSFCFIIIEEREDEEGNNRNESFFFRFVVADTLTCSQSGICWGEMNINCIFCIKNRKCLHTQWSRKWKWGHWYSNETNLIRTMYGNPLGRFPSSLLKCTPGFIRALQEVFALQKGKVETLWPLIPISNTGPATYRHKWFKPMVINHWKLDPTSSIL